MSLGARSVVVAVLLAAWGCGGADRPAPEFTVGGASVLVDSTAPFTQQPDFPERVEGTLAAALGYWGGTWDDLAGATITFTDAPHVACGAEASALGCQDGRSIRLTVRDPGLGEFACVEQTVLVHEIGHAVIGDPRHEDPRWMELEPLADLLGPRVGYTRMGEIACVLYVSVWRHPLGIP